MTKEEKLIFDLVISCDASALVKQLTHFYLGASMTPEDFRNHTALNKLLESVFNAGNKEGFRYALRLLNGEPSPD